MQCTIQPLQGCKLFSATKSALLLVCSVLFALQYNWYEGSGMSVIVFRQFYFSPKMQVANLKRKRQNIFIMPAGCSEADNQRQCWTKSFTMSLCTLQDIGIHGEATMQYASWMECARFCSTSFRISPSSHASLWFRNDDRISSVILHFGIRRQCLWLGNFVIRHLIIKKGETQTFIFEHSENWIRVKFNKDKT